MSIESLEVQSGIDFDYFVRKLELNTSLDSEFSGEYAELGNEFTKTPCGNTLNTIDPNTVNPSDVVYVFWYWVDASDVDFNMTENRESAYLSVAEPPFGVAIPVVSEGDDNGAYVAFVLSYQTIQEWISES